MQPRNEEKIRGVVMSVKVTIIEGTIEEVKQIIELKESGDVLIPRAPEIGEERTEKPAVLDSLFEIKEKKVKGKNTSTHYSRQECSEIKAFYLEPKNHKNNGRLKGKLLTRFAKSLGRNRAAINTKIYEMGLRRQTIIGGKNREKVVKKIFGGKAYSSEEREAIKEFYDDPKNHYDNGNIIHERLKVFSQTIGRTLKAVLVQFDVMNLNKTLVKGEKHSSKNFVMKTREEYMLRKKPTKPFTNMDAVRLAEYNKSHATKEWPDLGVNANQEIQISVFKQFMFDEQKRTMSYTHYAFIFGIENNDSWRNFIVNVFMNAEAICAYFKKPNLWKITDEGKELTITYGGKEK
jgi:hypothetical protein